MKMKLVKEIKVDRAKELNEYSFIKQKFSKLKKEKNNKLTSINNLNYYFVIEFEDLLDNPEFFKSLFSRENMNINNFKKLEDDYINGLNESKKSNFNELPKFFKKLGEHNKINGCYLVATIKTDKTKITTHNSQSTISIKLNLKELPNEFKKMCGEFYDYKEKLAEQEREEMNKIVNMTFEQQNKLMSNILRGIDFSSVNIFGPSNPILSFKKSPNEIFDFNTVNSKVRIEDVIENKIQDISDINFLNNLLKTSEQSENFELCVKLRDRINQLSKK